MVAGAIAAGARFYAGYPISPSSEVAKGAAKELPRHGGVYIQMEDEISSMAALCGASLAGKKAFTATSGPGFSLMQENLGLAVMSELPCVVYDVQRSGPSTGAATKPAQGDLMQARYGTHGDHSIIALAPSSVQDCYDLSITRSTLLRNIARRSFSWLMKSLATSVKRSASANRNRKKSLTAKRLQRERLKKTSIPMTIPPMCPLPWLVPETETSL